MQCLKGILNSFFSMHTILWLNLVFGYYLKFTNSLFVNILVKLYCVSCCGVIIAYTILIDDPTFDTSFSGTLYDAALVTEILANVLLSIINEERILRKFSSDLTLEFSSIKQHYFVVYLTIVVLCLLKSCSIFMVDIEKVTSLDLFMNIFTFCAFCCGRSTFICVADCYLNIVHVLCKSLKEQLQKNNLKDIEKVNCVKHFLSSYVKLSNNTFSTITVIRLKVCLILL